MVAWLFAGQGSQRPGMGEGLFDRYPGHVRQANEVLGFDIAELCLRDPLDRLRDTAFAQPALFVVSALEFLDRAQRDGLPKYLAGHSLGEYAALFAAGCFDFGTGVRLVRRRGELMARAAGGGMLAVVGAPVEEVVRLLETEGGAGVDVANHNAADQVVLSGQKEALREAEAYLAGRLSGARCVALNVSAAFHSRFMADAAHEFARYLEQFDLADPELPVLSNVTGRPYEPGTVRGLLGAQIREPVRWEPSMRYLLEHGVTEIVELGPGNVLRGLWRAAKRAHRPVRPVAAAPTWEISAQTLGSAAFREDYGLRYAYLAGAMYHGIASADLVERMGDAGLMGFFGSGGLRLGALDEVIGRFQRRFGPDGRYGMNLLSTLDNPRLEREVVDLFLRRGVRYVEAAGYAQITPPLVRWRFSGAHRDRDGRPVARHFVVAKVSRPEVATEFLSPAPEPILRGLVAEGLLTADEAEVARSLPLSDDVCVESDSAGHTDGGVALVLLPSMLRLRDEITRRHGYPKPIRVGAAGGLGTPEAIAAMFVLGADFVVTGSINQCTPQAGTSPEVKDLLALLDVQDTTYAPAGDLFELGAQVQVSRKGTLFAVRASRLYQMYRQYRCLDDIDAATRRTIEQDWFGGRSFAEIWEQTEAYLAERNPDELERALRDPRRRMALVFRWYFRWSTEMALRGEPGAQVNYQIHCGPAMGAFNRWVAGSDLADWRARDVAVIADRLMLGAAQLLTDRMTLLAKDIRPAAAAVPLLNTEQRERAAPP